tara:strand:+ start:14356 stop:14793 length:438 start_codon:yes stop_codon:yes gene_type:complete
LLNPSRYRIIAIGKVRKSWIKEGSSLYLKRLNGLTITELRDSNLQKESLSIQSSLKDNELVILLSEKGQLLSSISFAHLLKSFETQRLAFVIGGANGVSTEFANRAHTNLSLSPLTFTHDIARLLLLEQLYRAQTILQRTPYHRT